MSIDNKKYKFSNLKVNSIYKNNRKSINLSKNERMDDISPWGNDDDIDILMQDEFAISKKTSMY